MLFVPVDQWMKGGERGRGEGEGRASLETILHSCQGVIIIMMMMTMMMMVMMALTILTGSLLSKFFLIASIVIKLHSLSNLCVDSRLINLVERTFFASNKTQCGMARGEKERRIRRRRRGKK